MELFNITRDDFKSFQQIYPTLDTARVKGGKDAIFSYGRNELVKTFDGRTASYITNKVRTLISLSHQQEEENLSGINYPSGFLSVDNKLIGYVMPNINGKTLDQILNDSSIPFEEKKIYLKELGKLLEEMKRIRDESYHQDFYLNDLHARNIMFDENGNIKAIDVDSMSIDENDIAPSMFLKPMVRLTKYGKYNNISKGCMGSQITPTYDTELYCYSFIILNYLFGEKLIYMHDDEFERYLSYLESIGYDKELIEVFRRLYSEKENINPMDYIESLEDNPLAKRNYYQRYKVRQRK